MNSKLLTVLAAVCLVCAVILAGEWFYAEWAQKLALTTAISVETKIAQDEIPTLALTQKTEDSYTDLVARPLFIKDRKPVDEPTPEEAQANAAVAVVFDWELNGVYTTKKGLSALFSRAKSKVAKDNYRKISVGADLDGWKLTEIDRDKALLMQGTQQKELLLRKPKLKDSSRLPHQPNIPNIPNAPQPEDNQPPPAEGELDNTNE
jgi:hypothetical protein